MADRLVNIIVRHGSAATRRQIVRAHLTGADLEQAIREAAGLIMIEDTYQNGRRSRSQTFRLTLPGVWQAIRLSKGYNPSLALQTLAGVEIKAMLDRLEAERNPLALEIARDRGDAQEYRRQLKANEIRKQREDKAVEGILRWLSKPHKRLGVRTRERFNRFLALRGKAPVESKGKSADIWAPTFLEPRQARNQADSPVEPKTIGEPVPTAAPSAQCARCSFCLQCHFNSDRCTCGPNHICGDRRGTSFSPPAAPIEIQPTVESDDPASRVKIEEAGFGTAIMGPNRAKFGGEIVSFAEFVRRQGL